MTHPLSMREDALSWAQDGENSLSQTLMNPRMGTGIPIPRSQPSAAIQGSCSVIFLPAAGRAATPPMHKWGPLQGGTLTLNCSVAQGLLWETVSAPAGTFAGGQPRTDAAFFSRLLGWVAAPSALVCPVGPCGHLLVASTSMHTLQSL